MRRLLTYGTVLLLIVAPLSYGHHGPSKLTINAAAKKQPGVPFAHDQHATTLVKSCEKCHHTNKGLTSDTVSKMKVEKCSACHLDPKTPTVPSMRDASPQKNPFHSLCIGCHKEQKKGPTVCKNCHKK